MGRDLVARAGVALDEARDTLPGDARAEATRKAAVLRNAAEMHQALCAPRPADSRSATR